VSGAHSATATFYSATCTVLYNHASLQYSLNYSEHAMVHIRYNHVTLKGDKQTSTTTNVVDVNWTVTVINRLRLPLSLFMTLRIPAPRTVVGAEPWRMDTNFRQ